MKCRSPAGQMSIQRAKINQPRGGSLLRHRHRRGVPRRFAHSRGAKPRIQFSRKTRVRARESISKRRGAPTNILLPTGKHVLSHTPVSRTGTTLSHRIARRHAPTFLPLFFSRSSSRRRFFRERPTGGARTL